MRSRPESEEAIINRLLPCINPDRRDRADAWNEWQVYIGKLPLLRFIRFYNNTNEPDEDILQDALLVAFQEVESGRYERRAGIPFTAYVKGIARNKIREARRRERGLISLEDMPGLPVDGSGRQLETIVEGRELRRVLAEGLAMLPEGRRKVLEHYLYGDSTAEIAATLAITEELVRQHKSRGVRSLQQMSRLA